MVTRRGALTTIAGIGAGAGLAETAAAETQPRRKRGGSPGVYDVAVVGAGVFGVWTAWHLAKRGASVAVIDAYGVGHARASSGGESRVIRMSYGADPIYSPMARESLGAWAELSARGREPILHRTGVLWFSPSTDEYMAKSVDWLAANKVEHKRMDRAALGAAYPQVVFRDGESGFLETQSGALIAGRGVRAVLADAGLTAQIARAEHAPVQADLTYSPAPGVRARSVVYACGPWLPQLFPQVLGGRITPTRQEVYHFGAAAGDTRFSPPALPVWADFNGGELVYGMPDLEGQGFKIAFDPHGPVVDPDTQSRQPSTDGVARARAYLAHRFPGLADAPLIHARVCQYENSSNGDFLMDRLPGHPNVWLLGGGSGHGFKHGPAVGRRMAAHVLEPDTPVEPRFSLATKATRAERSVY